MQLKWFSNGNNNNSNSNNSSRSNSIVDQHQQLEQPRPTTDYGAETKEGKNRNSKAFVKKIGDRFKTFGGASFKRRVGDGDGDCDGAGGDAIEHSRSQQSLLSAAKNQHNDGDIRLTKESNDYYGDDCERRFATLDRNSYRSRHFRNPPSEKSPVYDKFDHLPFPFFLPASTPSAPASVKSLQQHEHEHEHEQEDKEHREHQPHSTPLPTPSPSPKAAKMAEEEDPAVIASLTGAKVSLPYPSFSKSHSKEVIGTRESAKPSSAGAAPRTESPSTTGSNTNEPSSNWSGFRDKNADGDVVTPDSSMDFTAAGIGSSKPTKENAKTTAESSARESQPLPQQQQQSHASSRRGRDRDRGRDSERDSSQHRSSRPPSPPLSNEDVNIPERPRHRASMSSRARPTSVDARAYKSHTRDRGDERYAPSAHRSRSKTKVSSSGRSSAHSDKHYYHSHHRQRSSPDKYSPGTPVYGNRPSPVSHTASPLKHSTPKPRSGPGASSKIPISPGSSSPEKLPRIDYLLRNGGLPNVVHRHFLGAIKPPGMAREAEDDDTYIDIYDPFHRLLDDYQYVIKRGGSIAVATGYRSVARRLLDRLESVFARDISSEECFCPMCSSNASSASISSSSPKRNNFAYYYSQDVSWGEILELVSGRANQELPLWPPFSPSCETSVAKIDDSGIFHDEPMQKLDIDIPQSWRDHYIRESRKKKQAVDKWLSGSETSSRRSTKVEQLMPDPEDLDDETLVFAMATHLHPKERVRFYRLLNYPSGPPRPGTNYNGTILSDKSSRERPEYLELTALAIRRLYRMVKPPRDPEVAWFMLKNPDFHNILATTSAISNEEWDILTSGRFDGFLRSGAENDIEQGAGAAYAEKGMRTASPDLPRSSGTPSPVNGAANGGAILVDEEQEIKALSEMDRDIHYSMESLEDAFEALHKRSIHVRELLRNRRSGLQNVQRQRKLRYEAIAAKQAEEEGRLAGRDESDDDGIPDDLSELAPDDSASNVGYSRKKKLRSRILSERREPTVPEEEEEEDDSKYRRKSRR